MGKAKCKSCNTEYEFNGCFCKKSNRVCPSCGSIKVVEVK